MVQVSYPGVYIQEVPSGVRTITSVSTSITTFIDFFREGPMDEAVQIFGMTDFNRVYGGLDSRSAASYAISQFFLNGGSEAFVVRVGTQSGADQVAAATVTIMDSHTGGNAAMTVSAINEGVWGNNLRLVIEHNGDPAGTFNLIVTRFESTDPAAQALVTEEYLSLSVNPTSGRYFPNVINEASNLIRVEHDAFDPITDPATYNLPAATGTLGKPIDPGVVDAAAIAALHPADKTFEIDVRRPTGAATSESVSELHTATLPFDNTNAPTDLRQLRTHLEQAIRTATPTAVTTHPLLKGATVEVLHDPVADRFRYLVRTDPGASDYAPDLFIDIGQEGTSTAAETLGFTGAGINENVHEYVLGITTFRRRGQQGNNTEGDDGLMPDPTVDTLSDTDAAPIADALIGDPANKSGLYALKDVDLFNILCHPLAAKLPQDQMSSVVSKALAYCEERRAFMIIDVPVSINEVQEMKDWMDDNAGFRHKNTATYFPHPRIPDPLNEYRLRTVGASGTLAGIYARTDGSRGVWKAPAGIEAGLRGVPELDVKLTDAQNGTLNPLGINCLRTFPIHGPIAWGGRTLQGADAIGSEWKYIPVRRLALMLEESLFRGTKWVVFEPNDEPTWANIRLNVGAYMMSRFRDGAFQGTDPKDAFYVKCDKETTTQDDINKGIVNIEVGFAPLKPAEFVVIKIQQIVGQL